MRVNSSPAPVETLTMTLRCDTLPPLLNHQFSTQSTQNGESSMAQKICDAIVVGSGATGGWAAKELAEKGLNVLVLEAGRKVNPGEEYNMLAWPYELPYRGFGNRAELERTQPIQ